MTEKKVTPPKTLDKQFLGYYVLQMNIVTYRYDEKNAKKLFDTKSFLVNHETKRFGPKQFILLQNMILYFLLGIHDALRAYFDTVAGEAHLQKVQISYTKVPLCNSTAVLVENVNSPNFNIVFSHKYAISIASLLDITSGEDFIFEGKLSTKDNTFFSALSEILYLTTKIITFENNKHHYQMTVFYIVSMIYLVYLEKHIKFYNYILYRYRIDLYALLYVHQSYSN